MCNICLRTIVSVLSYPLPLIQSIHSGVTQIYRLYTVERSTNHSSCEEIDRRHVVNVIHLLYSRTSITRVFFFLFERFNKRFIF